MHARIARATAAALVCGLLVLPLPASAHEDRQAGDIEMIVGFGTEPAYAGQPNSVQLILSRDGEPVVDLGDTLEVEVSFGDEAVTMGLEPHFAVGAFGEPGDYRAWFIPTRAGRYTFRFTGTVDGQQVDESFTSGPNTFSEVENPSDIQFPVQDPSTGELAELIDRIEPRLQSSVDEAAAAALAAQATAVEALSASEGGGGGRTLGLIGLIAGLLGLAVGLAALVAARRRVA